MGLNGHVVDVFLRMTRTGTFRFFFNTAQLNTFEMKRRRNNNAAAPMATSTLKGSYDEDEDGELEASSLVCRALLGFVAIVASLSFFFFWWGITRYNSPTGFSLLEVLFFCRQQPLITAKWQPMCRTLHLLHCPCLSCVRSSLNCAAQIPRRKVPKKMFCSVWHCIIIILIMPHLIVRIIYVGVCETFTGHTNSDK